MKYICGSGCPTHPIFFLTLPLNVNLLFGEKYLTIGTFSDFDAMFFVKCFNKIF